MRNQKTKNKKLLSTLYFLLSTFILAWLILPQAQALAATLTITANNGLVIATPDKSDYAVGEVVELKTKPETGYYFTGWAGDAQGKWLVLNLTMDRDKTIIANFDTWKPPIGIPMPEFGIFETHYMYEGQMYDFGSGPEPYKDAGNGPYTHYVDNTHPNATDIDNPYGTESIPRKTIRMNMVLAAGSVVEVHSALPLSGAFVISGEGTREKPIFVRGVGNPRIEGRLSVGYYGNSRYIIVEGISFFSGSVTGRAETVAFDTSYISIRNCDFHGDENSGRVGIGSHTSNLLENIVFYNNAVHDNGIWDPDIAEGDRDIGGIGFGKSSYVWIVDNEIYHNEQCAVQSVGGTDYTANHHKYIGRNIAHHNKQTAFWTKHSSDIIFSENIAYGHRASSSDPHGAGGGLQYGPQRVWFLFNHFYDNNMGIGCPSGSVEGGVYIIGNLIQNNIDRGIRFYTSGDFYVLGNVIYDTEGGIRCSGGSTSLHASNNIIANMKSPDSVHLEVLGDLPNRANASYNLFYQEGGEARIRWGGLYNVSEFQSAHPDKSEGCIEADSQFIDPTNNDFHLQPTSPAIDAGTSSGVVQQVFDRFEQLYGIDIRKDLDGNPRPQGDELDMGVYEVPDIYAYITANVFSGTMPLIINFDGSNSGTVAEHSIVSYEWDFGDGQQGTGAQVTHTYTTEGTYIVSLTVTDDRTPASTHTASRIITVTDPIKGDVNGDGKVNIQDVQACVNHISGTQNWESAADVDGDGKVDRVDVERIVNIILGK